MPDYPETEIEHSERMRNIIKRDRDIARQISQQPKPKIDTTLDFTSMYPTINQTQN